MPTDALPRPILELTATSSTRPDSVLMDIAQGSMNATDDGGAVLCWFLGGNFYVDYIDSFVGRRLPYHWHTAGPEVARAPQSEIVRELKEATDLSDERIARLIGVSRQTLANWDKGAPISDTNRRRLLLVRSIIEQAARLYPTPADVAAWLDTPRGADGVTPAEATERQDWDRARYLAVAAPSSRLVRPPGWVRRAVPEAFSARAEHRQEPYPGEDPTAVALSNERG